MRQRRDKALSDDAQPGPASRPPQLGQASFNAVLSSLIDEGGVFVVRAGKTRHKDRPRQHWRESEYTQVAMLTIHRGVPPRDVDRTKLWRNVNAWLAKDPGFQATGIGEISRKTVARELEKLQRQP
jgi:hypothetical protein